jgi:hypothetical protein
VIMLDEKHKSIMEGELPFRGKWVRCPGLLWRKKLCILIQLAMESASAR